MSKQLKVGLIGAGVFASYHAQKLSHHPRVKFTGIVDQNGKHAAELAGKHNVAHMSLGDLLALSDAVVLATSATAHKALSVLSLIHI